MALPNLKKDDFELISGNLEEHYSEMKIKSASKEEINEKVRNAVFKYLKNLLKEHSKITKKTLYILISKNRITLFLLFQTLENKLITLLA